MTRPARRRVEAAVVLLAFPVATALTALVVTSPAAGVRPASSAADRGVEAVGRERVVVRGSDAIDAFALADVLEAKRYVVVSVAAGDNAIGTATEVVYYERADRPAAARLRNLLGVGTIRLEQAFSSGSDLTIFMGKDLHST